MPAKDVKAVQEITIEGPLATDPISIKHQTAFLGNLNPNQGIALYLDCLPPGGGRRCDAGRVDASTSSFDVFPNNNFDEGIYWGPQY